MNFTGHSERKSKPDVAFQYFRAALPSAAFPAGFHTYGTSRHLVNTKTESYKEHAVGWPVTKESSASRPGYLRLDSQGEYSKNEWVRDSSYAVSSSSGTLAVFSDILRRYADTHVRHRKPEPIKPCNNSLNITSAVKLLCRKSDILFPCHQRNEEKVTVASSDDIAMSRTYSLRCQSQLVPRCAGITPPRTQPVELLSGLQFQLEEQQNHLHQKLSYGFPIPKLSVSTLLPVSLPYVVDFPDYVSAFKQRRYENSVNQLSVVSFSSSDMADSTGTPDTSWVHRQGRRPRYNCRRKWLRVCYNTRFRKPSAHSGKTHAATIARNAYECDFIHSDVSINDCSDDSQENELLSKDTEHDMRSHFPSVCDVVRPCDENRPMWFDHCCSQPPTLSSVCDVPQTPVQESCSFASLFFVSGDEMDDFCSTDSCDSDCGGFLSPLSACRTDDDDTVLANALLSGLSCIPFTDSWVMGCFSNCTPTGGVREANARWNEAYSLPADVVFDTSQPHPRMVRSHE